MRWDLTPVSKRQERGTRIKAHAVHAAPLDRLGMTINAEDRARPCGPCALKRRAAGEAAVGKCPSTSEEQKDASRTTSNDYC